MNNRKRYEQIRARLMNAAENHARGTVQTAEPLPSPLPPPLVFIDSEGTGTRYPGDQLLCELVQRVVRDAYLAGAHRAVADELLEAVGKRWSKSELEELGEVLSEAEAVKA